MIPTVHNQWDIEVKWAEGMLEDTGVIVSPGESRSMAATTWLARTASVLAVDVAATAMKDVHNYL